MTVSYSQNLVLRHCSNEVIFNLFLLNPKAELVVSSTHPSPSEHQGGPLCFLVPHCKRGRDKKRPVVVIVSYCTIFLMKSVLD